MYNQQIVRSLTGADLGAFGVEIVLKVFVVSVNRSMSFSIASYSYTVHRWSSSERLCMALSRSDKWESATAHSSRAHDGH